MSTIFEIATRAGVSKSTVAGVLNRSPRFSDRTRRRVLRVADELGYRPNYLSKALAGARSMTIGVVVGSYDPLVMNAVKAIEARAREAEYRPFILFAVGADPSLVAAAVRDVLDRRVDGLIVYAYQPFRSAIQAVLDRAPMPVVYMRADPAGARHVIPMRRDAALRELAAHLRNLGHRAAADLRWPSDPGVEPELHAAYQRAFAAEGVELTTGEPWIMNRIDAESDATAAYRTVRWALLAGHRPTAISVADDELAVAVMAAIADAGLRVPADISVVGKDGHPMAEFCRPSLTTILEPQAEAGDAAFVALSELMRDPQAQAALPSFEATLMVRGSTGPARTGELSQGPT